MAPWPGRRWPCSGPVAQIVRRLRRLHQRCRPHRPQVRRRAPVHRRVQAHRRAPVHRRVPVPRRLRLRARLRRAGRRAAWRALLPHRPPTPGHSLVLVQKRVPALQAKVVRLEMPAQVPVPAAAPELQRVVAGRGPPDRRPRTVRVFQQIRQRPATSNARRSIARSMNRSWYSIAASRASRMR